MSLWHRPSWACTLAGPYRHDRPVLGLDAAAAERFAHALLDREAAGLPISTADAPIETIGWAHDVACATRSTRDFAHTSITLIDPWAAA